MKNINIRTRKHQIHGGKAFGHRWGSSPPVQELKEGFDEWVKKLRLIMQIPKKMLIIPNLWKKIKKNRTNHNQ